MYKYKTQVDPFPDFHWKLLFSSNSGGEDVSELLENFPSFTSKMWSDSSNLNRSESSLYAENQRLREVMEKERYRRKVCRGPHIRWRVISKSEICIDFNF